jgi:hypothetical protein
MVSKRFPMQIPGAIGIDRPHYNTPNADSDSRVCKVS